MVDLGLYLCSQKQWSLAAFGPGTQTENICAHIEKEVNEIREKPDDLMEWIDVMMLAMDGAWRAGYSPAEIENALIRKHEINKARRWKLGENGQPNEHVRD